jgi:pimeloyl-ACP methyl ester carboxylesterase
MNLGVKTHIFENNQLYWYGNDIDPQKMTIIFLHGFPDNAYIWENQLTVLSEKYNVIAPFIWGTNNGEIYPKKCYKSSYCAKAYADLLESFHLKQKVFLVAHDMGGPIAGVLGTLIKIEKMIFMNSFTASQFLTRLKNPLQIMKSIYMIPFQLPIFSEKYLKFASKGIIEKVYKVGGLKDYESYLAKNNYGLINWELYRQNMTDKMLWSVKEKFPVIFVWGIKDNVMIAPNESELSDLSTVSQMYQLRCGHWPQMSRPDEVNAIIEKEFSLE